MKNEEIKKIGSTLQDSSALSEKIIELNAENENIS